MYGHNICVLSTVIPESGKGGFTREEFLKHLKEDIVGLFSPLFPDAAEDAFKALEFFYSPWPDIDDKEKNRMMFNNVNASFRLSYFFIDKTDKPTDKLESLYKYLSCAIPLQILAKLDHQTMEQTLP